MRTRHLLSLGLAFVVAVLGAALITTPRHTTAYVPAKVNVAAAAVTTPREATPVSYTLPPVTNTPGECGQPNTVTYPDSTEEVSFDAFTTGGYIKIVAVLSDTGRSFTWPPTEGWKVNPIAPYRAEYLVPLTVTGCEEPAPVPPAPVTEPPVTETPAPQTPAEEEEHGTHDCRG